MHVKASIPGSRGRQPRATVRPRLAPLARWHDAGEHARRRDPRRFKYRSEHCPFKKQARGGVSSSLGRPQSQLLKSSRRGVAAVLRLHAPKQQHEQPYTPPTLSAPRVSHQGAECPSGDACECAHNLLEVRRATSRLARCPACSPADALLSRARPRRPHLCHRAFHWRVPQCAGRAETAGRAVASHCALVAALPPLPFTCWVLSTTSTQR
jgi:hypothetical protein